MNVRSPKSLRSFPSPLSIRPWVYGFLRVYGYAKSQTPWTSKKNFSAICGNPLWGLLSTQGGPKDGCRKMPRSFFFVGRPWCLKFGMWIHREFAVDLPRLAWLAWLADMGLRVFAGFYLRTPNPRHHGPPKKNFSPICGNPL